MIILSLIGALFCLSVSASEEAGLHLPDTLRLETSIFSAAGPQQDFSPKTIFDYINGAADVYVDAGMEQCHVRQYALGENEALEVNAYDMGSELRAFGLYGEACSDPGPCGGSRRLNVWKGRYFIEVIDKSTVALDPSLLNRAAAFLSGPLPGSSGIPGIFDMFPESGRVPGSEKYIHEDFMSRPFLKDVLTCDYRDSSGTAVLFAVQSPSDSIAAVIYRRLTEQGGRETASLMAVQAGSRIVGADGSASRKSKLRWLELYLKRMKTGGR